ncbi:hypothetical protein [Phyllobacterium salinisoli]|uniref:hypothetical protein n=1 Tax=Phyllobacterium salinisoli TaxID=1899321 RepID=UPI00190F94C3|nr:hypothetical protein [Phyllobacterium salinisoli]
MAQNALKLFLSRERFSEDYEETQSATALRISSSPAVVRNISPANRQKMLPPSVTS